MNYAVPYSRFWRRFKNCYIQKTEQEKERQMDQTHAVYDVHTAHRYHILTHV